MPLTDTLNPNAPLTEHTPTEGSPFIKSFMGHAATIPNADAPAAPAPKPDAPETPAATPDPKAAATTPETPKQPEQTKPAETTTTDIPDTITSAKAADWKKLKQLREDADKRASDFEKQYKAATEELTKLKTKPPVDPEFQSKFEQTQKERDEMLARIERLNIELSPRFENHFKPKFEAIREQVKNAAGAEKAELVQALLDSPETSAWRKNTLNEVLHDMPSEADKHMLVAALREHDALRRERDGILKNAREEHKKLQEREALEAAEQKQKHATLRESLHQEALELARNYDAFKVTDDPAQAESVKQNEGFLKRLISGELDKKTFLETGILSVEAKRLKSALEGVMKERDELKAAVAAYQQGNPGLQGGETKDGQTAQVQTPYGPSPFMTSIKQGFREAGVTR